MILFMLGTFLVNFVPTLVLFESGVSRSFVSSSFLRGFSIAQEALSRLLTVSIPDKHLVSATNIYWGYVLDIFGVRYPINLTIAMGNVCHY